MPGPSSIPIELNDQEWLYSMLIGWSQFCRAKRNGYNDTDNWRVDKDPDKLSGNMNGKCGEQAYCKWRGIYFDPRMNAFKGPDAETNVQVRTLSKARYDLIHKKRDEKAHRYVLLTGWAPSFVIRGWMWGHECRQDRYWADKITPGNFAWFVPQEDLHSMETFT